MDSLERRVERREKLLRQRGGEITLLGDLEAGVYSVPASEPGKHYRVDVVRETCTCPARTPHCKHISAAGTVHFLALQERFEWQVADGRLDHITDDTELPL